MARQNHFSRYVLWGTIVLALLLSLVIWPLSQLGKGDPAAEDGAEAELRILPVARLEMKKTEGMAKAGPRSGEQVYSTFCLACHASGVAGAPKAGDKAAWSSRIATGSAALLQSATNGKGAMPPRGGAPDLTDDELKAAVEYLIGLSR